MMNFGEVQDALTKQEPVKPRIHNDIEWYFCGLCHGLVHHKGNYCHHCGQKIDWGKE